MPELDFLLDRLLSGYDPYKLMTVLIVVSLVCRLIGKAIPDSATGWLGWVRKAAKVVGLYTSARIMPGISQKDLTLRALRTSQSALGVAMNAEQGEPQPDSTRQL